MGRKTTRLKDLSLFDPSIFDLNGEQSVEGREVAKGIRAVSDRNKRIPEPKQGVDVAQVLPLIADPNSGLTEVTLPDGTSIKGTFAATEPYQLMDTGAPMANENLGAYEPPPKLRKPAPNPKPPTQPATQGAPNQLQPTHATAQLPNDQLPAGEGALANVGNFLVDPQVQEALGQLAKALGTVGNYQTPGAQLGQSIIEDAHREVYGKYLAALQNGEDVTKNPEFSILTPQERVMAQQQILAGQKMGLAQQQVGIEQQKQNTYDRLADAQIRGMLTAEDKKKLAEIQNATRLKIGEMAYHYLRLNQMQYLDMHTGEVFTVPGGDITKLSGQGNINASVSKLLQDQTATLFLDKALDNYKASLPEKDQKSFNKLKALSAVFNYDPTSGTIAWEKVFNYLSKEDQYKFAQELLRLSANVAAGVPPTAAFATSPLIPNPAPNPNPTGQQGGTGKPVVKVFPGGSK